MVSIFTERVILLSHNPRWIQLASCEMSIIASILGPELITIHHIGSTSIPGIKAKPIIDLLGVVSNLQFINQNSHLLENLEYILRGELGIPGRRYFTKPAQRPRTHHLHIYEQGDLNIDRHLLFRDYLLTHQQAALAYERLKEQLAIRFPDDRASYTDGKTDFILDIEQKATEWHKKSGHPDRQNR